MIWVMMSIAFVLFLFVAAFVVDYKIDQLAKSESEVYRWTSTFSNTNLSSSISDVAGSKMI